jgi:hypothetical protein
MKMIFEVISTARSTMSIIYPKERAPWPLRTYFIFRLNQIEDYGNPIFIVVADKTLVGCDCIGVDYSIGLFRDFCCSSERISNFFIAGKLQGHLGIFSPGWFELFLLRMGLFLSVIFWAN